MSFLQCKSLAQAFHLTQNIWNDENIHILYLMRYRALRHDMSQLSHLFYQIITKWLLLSFLYHYKVTPDEMIIQKPIKIKFTMGSSQELMSGVLEHFRLIFSCIGKIACLPFYYVCSSLNNLNANCPYHPDISIIYFMSMLMVLGFSIFPPPFETHQRYSSSLQTLLKYVLVVYPWPTSLSANKAFGRSVVSTIQIWETHIS